MSHAKFSQFNHIFGYYMLLSELIGWFCFHIRTIFWFHVDRVAIPFCAKKKVERIRVKELSATII